MKNRIYCAACTGTMYYNSATNKVFTMEDVENSKSEKWVCLPCRENFSTEKLFEMIRERRK